MDVFIIHKVWFDAPGDVSKCDCFAFSSWWAANRAMYDDWIAEYDRRPDGPKKGELFDKDKHDPDGFWERQAAPLGTDWRGMIIFREGNWVSWHIVKRKVNDLSPDWYDNPGFEPKEE